jgi:hypothetical protein
VLNSIKPILTLFFEICLFRRNPEDIPASRFLMFASLAALVTLGLAIGSLSLPLKDALISTGINLFVLVIITQLLLILYSKQARFIQTMTAMAGAGIVISIFAIPVMVMFEYCSRNDINAAPLSILWLLLVIWEVVVMAHIIKHALACQFFLALMVAVLYPWIYFKLIGLFITVA